MYRYVLCIVKWTMNIIWWFKFDSYCTVHTKERQSFNEVLKLEYELPHQNGCTISIYIYIIPQCAISDFSENEQTIYPPIVFSLVDHCSL